MTVETLKQTSVVNGGETYYVRLTAKTQNYVINVGKKTFDTINKLIEEDGETVEKTVNEKLKTEVKK